MRPIILALALVALSLPNIHCYGPPTKGKKPSQNIHQPTNQECGPSGCVNAPVNQGCGPSGCGNSPIDQGCGPSGCGNTPLDQGCGTSGCGNAPLNQGCGPSGCGNAPVNQKCGPNGCGSTPLKQGCGPNGCGNAPIYQGSAQPPNYSQNPFLNGGINLNNPPPQQAVQHKPFAPNNPQQPVQQKPVISNNIEHGGNTPDYSNNPFLQGGSSGPAVSQTTCTGAACNQGPNYSNNPFLTGQVAPQQPSQQPSGQGSAPAGSGYGPGQAGVICNSGSVCINKRLCFNGFVNQNNANQGKPQGSRCDTNGAETCCTVTSRNDGPGLTHVQPQPDSSPGFVHVNPSQPSPGLVRPNPPGTDNRHPLPQRPHATNAPYTGPLNTTPHPGCAAALKCVSQEYCTREGVMSERPVVLTREENENRVPLSDCADPETGVVGKCCRDPNYKDPWPDMLPGGGCYDGTYCEVMERCANDKMAQPKATCNLVQQGSVGVCCLKSGTPTNTIFTRPPQQQGFQNQGTFQQQQTLSPRPPQNNFPVSQQQGHPRPVAQQPGFKPQPQQPAFQPQQPAFQPQPQQPAFQPQPQQPAFQPQPQQPAFQPQPQQPAFQPQPQQPAFQPKPQQPAFQPQPQQPAFQPQPQQPAFQPQPQQPAFQPQPQQPAFQPQPQQPAFQPQPQQPAFQPQPIDKIDTHPPVFELEQTVPPAPVQNKPHTQFFQTQSPVSSGGGSYNRPQSVKKPVQPVVGNHQFQPEQSQISQTPLIPPQYPQLSQQANPGQLCGVRRVSQFSGLQGEDGQSVPGEFPWLALISIPSNGSRLCAGALISDKAVLTSAHCVLGVSHSTLQVEVGSWSPYESNPERQTSSVAAIAKHPNFEPGSLSSDLAVLLLPTPLHLGRHVDLICLPEPSQLGRDGELLNPGGACVMSSWPKQAGAEGYLHRLAMSAVPKEKCEESLRQTYLGKYFQLNRSFMCAKPLNPQQDLCTVGLGGPLVCPQQDGRYVVTGASSWDVGCTERKAPSVLCAVDVSWVNEVLARPVEDFIQQSEQRTDTVAPEVAQQKPGFAQGYGK